MNTKLTPQDWFGVRFCAISKGSASLRSVYLDYASHHLIGGVPASTALLQAHLDDTQRRHYLLTAPAQAEMALLPVREGFDFSLLDTLPHGRGCLLFSPKHFIRYHVNARGLHVLDLDAERNPKMLQWAVKWADPVHAERSMIIWPSIERVVQALAFLHLTEPEFTEWKAQPVPPNLAARLLNPRAGDNPNHSRVAITAVGKGWNQFMLDTASGQVRGHVRLARVGKGWLQRRLVPVSPHERTRKIIRVIPDSQ